MANYPSGQNSELLGNTTDTEKMVQETREDAGPFPDRQPVRSSDYY